MNIIINKLLAEVNRFTFLEKVLVLWGLWWGILGWSLFFVGLIGLFYKVIVMMMLLVFFILGIFLVKKINLNFKPSGRHFITNLKNDKFLILILAVFFLFALLNFLAALAPELGYDALWYHLTLPKIWFMTHRISYIPGGVLYYSVMPRLGEIFLSIGLAFESTGTIAKIIHLLFGIFWMTGIYIFLRMFLTRRTSLFMAGAIYGTVLVSWLSQTAYIDLIVAFYVVMSLIMLWKYLKTNDDFFLILSAIFMGFNLASKLYGLFIAATFISVLLFKTGWKKTLKFTVIALLIVSPFYLQAYFSAGNPIYPVFSIRDSAMDSYLGGYHTIRDWYQYVWWRDLPRLLRRVLIYDFTPIFGLIILIFLTKKWRKINLFLVIFLIFFLLWSLVPMHEPRYFIVILPVAALLIGWVLENINWRLYKYLMYGLIFVVLLVNLKTIYQDYRKSFKVVFHKQSRMAYLKENLPLERNFYDVDGFFAKTVEPSDRVLTVEVGNMFYLDFPFWDWSFIRDRENYLISADVLTTRLKKEGYGYVLLGKMSLADWIKLPQDQLEEHFELIYDKNDFRLYRIK